MNRKHTEGQERMIDAFRARADQLGTTRPTGRFRSHSSLDDGPARERRVVAQAVARAKAGDHEAIRFLYMRYADNVYGYVRSIVRDHHEAEDVTQHVFAKLMTALPKYEARDVPFAAWILRVARNVALDHMRQRRAIPCEEVRELEPTRDDRGDSQQTSLSLREALEELPVEQREVVVLRHLVGLSPGEIAGRMNKSEPSVHGLHHRGRGALRSTLVERDCAPAVRQKVAA
jgi:RNA polymerase sigma-70 factor (ECF subfamily)